MVFGIMEEMDRRHFIIPSTTRVHYLSLEVSLSVGIIEYRDGRRDLVDLLDLLELWNVSMEGALEIKSKIRIQLF